MGSEYALFLGCTIPARVRSYEQSARAIAERFGIKLVDLEGFACCGFPIGAADRMSAESLAARNLSLAEEAGLPICTLCSSCTSALTETSRHLAEHPSEREEVNTRLARINRKYEGPVTVKHFARILWEEVGVDKISQACTRSLKGLRLAAHYGCHYLKPSEAYGGFELVEDPGTLDGLIRATGATAVDYMRKKQCCGGSVLGADQNTAFAIARDKLTELHDMQVDALVVVCPFCGVMFDANQKVIEKMFEQSFGLPVLYLTQVLGMAMGMDEKTLGLKSHVVKTTHLDTVLQERQKGASSPPAHPEQSDPSVP
ncbi:MAG: CoB--CoM heterodisulfide reductase subunit B [Deltaproteobacteria bacterium HGW-Deltaproteobacteria-15]|jgi:heterodisulfide reductase subunit B|nr:MAG: CoB--CoM heterodisulfide reductase subunit B [Deltaproteobacteria bacterium HGW-Deltaproteobacteria-15]